MRYWYMEIEFLSHSLIECSQTIALSEGKGILILCLLFSKSDKEGRHKHLSQLMRYSLA